MEETKGTWKMPALQHDLACFAGADPDFHDGYTPMRPRIKSAPIMQPRPRLTIVVTECDEARLRVLLEEQRHGHNLALLSCLETELAYASVVAPHLVAPDIVTMNSCVRYEMEGNGSGAVAQLVYPSRANDASRVSVLDPLGIALLGARAGQDVMWTLPNRQTRRLRVTDVPYQPERSGDFHL